MSFLKNVIRNAVGDGISKGIRDAVSAAAEKIVAPKAEAYANKVADSLDSAAGELDAAAASVNAEAAKAENAGAFSSLESSLNRLAQATEKYAATMEKAAVSQEALAKEWNEKVPGFPVWCFGGKDFWFDENGTSSDGNTYYWFCAENAPMEGLDMYLALLRQEGFVRKYPDSDEILIKDLGGEYLVFGTTDAFGTAPTMTVSMFRTKDRKEFED